MKDYIMSIFFYIHYTESGKRTIALLLARLYDPGEGRITIGGVDIRQLRRSELRRAIGLVLQEPFLYSKTLRDNVGIAVSHPSQQAIERAAVDASALSFIEDSENGESAADACPVR